MRKAWQRTTTRSQAIPEGVERKEEAGGEIGIVLRNVTTEEVELVRGNNHKAIVLLYVGGAEFEVHGAITMSARVYIS